MYVFWRCYGQKIRLGTNPTFFIGVPLGVMLLTIYKAIYQYLLIFDFKSLLDFEKMVTVIIFKTFRGSEAIITLSFVHGIETWKNNVIYEFSNIFTTTIPLFTSLIEDAFGFKVQAFSDFLEPLYFHDVGYGVGSNLWGSMYAAGGMIVTVLSMYVYLLMFFVFLVHSKRKQASTVFILPIMTLLSFYATRWELAAIVYIVLASYFCYLLVRLHRVLLSKNLESK